MTDRNPYLSDGQDTHCSPECCTCPRGTRVHLSTCPAGAGNVGTVCHRQHEVMSPANDIRRAYGNPSYPVLVIATGAQRAAGAFRSVEPIAFRDDLTLTGISNVNRGAFGAFRVVLTRG